MEIIATKDEKLKMVYEALTTGLPYFRDYGFLLDYDQGQYNNARKELRINGMPEEDICREDIWKQIIAMDHSLTFKDTESNDEPYFLNMETIDNNWNKVPMRVVMAFVTENYDAEDADQLIQYLLFGELVYG